MKIIQLNAWHNKLFNSILDLINEEDPDIICLQELMNSEEALLFDDLYLHSIQLLTRHTKLQHAFYVPHFTTQLSGKTISQGNGIFSKVPFVSTASELTYGEYFRDYDARAAQRQKVNDILVAQIESDGKKVTIANHHGFWMPDPYGNEASEESMLKANSFLQKNAGPYILCGDLNVTPDAPPMRVFDGLLENLTATQGISTTLSELHRVKDKPIACDAILVSPEIKVLSFGASEKLVSDHKALVLEFDL